MSLPRAAIETVSVAATGLPPTAPTQSTMATDTATTNAQGSSLTLPSASTFSFKAPFPASLKQRRVSLAMASSPKLVPACDFRDDTGLESHVAETSPTPEKRGKTRRIFGDSDGEEGSQQLEKKHRKKWTSEETQMLVDGCNKHGVGNWKTILSDPELFFDNRSPVDLKDRFRTYFPDAYKQHYPNARTHLSSKVRSTLPDGSSLFEKTRSKKRRPFTEEEDRALKAGYEKHGTIWAVIVKDPVFQDQGRRSTDLRDRFRNAFPDLYTAAGYKPRGNAKKKIAESSGMALAKSPPRAATDDQLAMSSTGNTQQRKKRRYTSQGLLRGGTKSVPQSAEPSDNEVSDAEQDNEPGPSGGFKRSNPMPPFKRPSSAVPSSSIFPDTDDMDMLPPFDPQSDPVSHNSSDIDSQSQAWSSGLDTPLHSSHHAWTGSPTTSSNNMSDFFLNSSPSLFDRRNDAALGGIGMIGNSAWGTQDWFSANPRMDPSGSSSSFDNSFSPSSPFSLNQGHGVVDRYDLVPSSFPQDFSSEVGSSSFSDEIYPPRREYHSNYAGDLIFGTRTQSQSFYDSPSSLSFGLGLTGIPHQQPAQQASIHPMALHTHALPGIDEIELNGITISDQAKGPHDSRISPDIAMSPGMKDDDGHEATFLLEQRFSLDDLVDLSHELHTTPPATPQTRPRRLNNLHSYSTTHGRSISVPPAERMAIHAPRPAQVHANSQPEVRPYSVLTDSHHTQSDINLNMNAFAPQSFSSLFHSINVGSPPTQQSTITQDMSRTASEISALPFLDLHYYGNGSGGGNAMEEADVGVMRQGQALDLASSGVEGSQMRRVMSSGNVEPRKVGGGSANGMGTIRASGHQRGQSAVVCPQDLVRSDTNKRKRASWDGAHS